MQLPFGRHPAKSHGCALFIVPAKFSCEVTSTQARISINPINTSGPICTLVATTVVYVLFTIHPCVTRFTTALIGGDPVSAVSMNAGVWRAFVYVDFAMGASPSLWTNAPVGSIELFTYPLMHTGIWAADICLQTASKSRVCRYFEKLLLLRFFCRDVSIFEVWEINATDFYGAHTSSQAIQTVKSLVSHIDVCLFS